MGENYTVIHLHSMFSNGVTNVDSITDYKEYIARAKELGMKAMCFTEHGSVFSWLHKKEEIENEYGGCLIWERLSENRACRIKDEIQCHTFEIDNWTEVFAFMKSAGQRMFDVFHKHIVEFDLQHKR